MLPQLYTPKYKLKRGYTEGNEYIVRNTNENYTGLYHIYPNGAIYSNGELTTDSVELIRNVFNDNPNNLTYFTLRNLSFDRYVYPVFYSAMPTPDDYRVGIVLRYFAQKINEPNTIIEIDSKQAKSANRSNKVGINRYIWNIQVIEWTISGNSEQVSKANKKVLSFTEQRMPGIHNYLTDPLEFYK